MAVASGGVCSFTLAVHRHSHSKERLEKGYSSLLFAKDSSYGSIRFKQNMSSLMPFWKAQLCQAYLGEDISSTRAAHHTAELHSDTENLSFIERLARAWHVLFPAKVRSTSNAEIAKQRLKMILIADRCSVNDEAKRKIVTNIVSALSHFVEIESEEKVQFTVTTDPDHGTVYAVTVPVRRVKPEYQDFSNELKTRQFLEDLGEGTAVNVSFE